MSAMGKHGESSVLWWVGWITLTILSFFACSYFWTGVIARHFGSMDRAGAPALWVSAVFGSWMVLLVPLIVLMYNKVDRSYEDGRIEREKKKAPQMPAGFKAKSVYVEDSKRLLNEALRGKLKHMPETLRKAHLVHAVLKDGRRVENIFVMNRKDVLGVYGRDKLDFDIRDIRDIEPADLDKLPAFKEERWLRLDGVNS